MKYESYLKTIAGSLLLALSSQLLAFTPSTAQIEQFKNLPASQQQALAKQYGFDLDSVQADHNTQPSFDEPSMVPTRHAKPLSAQPSLAADLISNEGEGEKNILKQFGYELFDSSPTSFAPAADIPIPENYIMGPGDNITVQLYGKKNTSYAFTVTREGQIQFPTIGPITVAGLSFVELKKLIHQTI